MLERIHHDGKTVTLRHVGQDLFRIMGQLTFSLRRLVVGVLDAIMLYRRARTSGSPSRERHAGEPVAVGGPEGRVVPLHPSPFPNTRRSGVGGVDDPQGLLHRARTLRRR